MPKKCEKLTLIGHLKASEARQAVNFVQLIFGLYKVILFMALPKVIILNLSSSETKSKLESTLQSSYVSLSQRSLKSKVTDSLPVYSGFSKI